MVSKPASYSGTLRGRKMCALCNRTWSWKQRTDGGSMVKVRLARWVTVRFWRALALR